MRRTTFDDTAPVADAKPGPKPLTLTPCRFCNTATIWETLSMYGARCHPCFRRYIDDEFPQPTRFEPLTRDEKVALLERMRGVATALALAPSKDWAYRLREREARGEHLSQAQRECWRAALREPAGAEA